MSWEADFNDMLPDTIVLSTQTAHNLYGEASFTGTPSTLKARVVAKPTEVRDSQGNVIEASHVIWVRSTGTIEPDAELTLSDGTTPTILRAERFPDQDGTHHWKLTCGF